ncbi:ABC-type sugar transport system, ATPase component [Sphaerotilus natans subsp. natans DSM 6575]|uniref:ABC-type sugar transport system, ATPase component n=1 Tax=Sphaerotilus natans subsp. natans DSM 6575 TaxID=1286631 RepID=A0A059KSY2_9BURK|nr:sugar ABC transporter ATP-binding protein [Sphaerotilus natans]KDB54344.1 ABC-type sugar transport system, ATPase component [Sphaerotilus natans subsp. natans DSM 6575]SIR07689.1 monosaccharide ABC transporter ATP-binding protein, CUT2 family [Sphaerotilus natans]
MLMPVAQNEVVLEMAGIVKTFPGVKALDGVNLKVRAGTVHVLVGENGAGKSTLMKILSGEHAIDGGSIRFKGRPLDSQNTRAALEMGIAMIHQELSPVPEMTIAENVFLGREPMRAGLLRGFVDFERMNRETQTLLDRLGLRYRAEQPMGTLSIAGMQLVEIAKAISRQAALLIMDEPTSAISDTEVEMLFRQIEDLKARGVAIIYISHKMEEIFRIADDITIIRDGQHVDAGPASAYDEQRLIALMVGRSITSIFPKEDVPIGDVVLEVRGLTRRGVFRDVSFQVRRGEILGLSGLVGAGRTEVVRAIFGLDAVDAGEIVLEGRPLTLRHPAEAIGHGIAMVSEDRKAEGLVLCRSVRENISLANLQRFTQGPLLTPAQEEAKCEEMRAMLQIKCASLDTVAGTLSGGNQQKIVIAKWLLGDLKVLILDEPTRGIDVGSKSEIHRLMTRFAREGLAVIMISSELPEVLGMSDRVVVMREGRVAGEIERARATQENIMTLATGGTLH